VDTSDMNQTEVIAALRDLVGRIRGHRENAR
jgi:hypothetical protein